MILFLICEREIRQRHSVVVLAGHPQFEFHTPNHNHKDLQLPADRPKQHTIGNSCKIAHAMNRCVEIVDAPQGTQRSYWVTPTSKLVTS